MAKSSLLGSNPTFLTKIVALVRIHSEGGRVVWQVRRQFRERPGIMTYAEKPDYARCVSIVAASALREMIKPGLLAVCSPVAIGVAFRIIGALTGQTLLGARAVAGMLMFATVTGIGLLYWFTRLVRAVLKGGGQDVQCPDACSLELLTVDLEHQLLMFTVVTGSSTVVLRALRVHWCPLLSLVSRFFHWQFSRHQILG